MRADKVLFPGVGEASSAMSYLREHGLDRVIVNLTQPVLGICIGLQLLCRHSEEGNADGLGLFDIDVRRFVPQNSEQKIPHMGWNTLHNLKGPLFEGVAEGSYAYFVHSYYIAPFCAALHRNNFYATQFHVEKSGAVGVRILENFLAL